MKSKLSISVLSIFAMISITSCNDDKAPILGAKVTITVKNSFGVPQKGTTVYMYKDTKPTQSTKPSDAHSQVVTDAKGVAVFDLNLTQLNILESQTSLYFVVFYTINDANFIAGDQGVTVKRNETKELSITIPL